jgi:hypothetical protein
LVVVLVEVFFVEDFLAIGAVVEAVVSCIAGAVELADIVVDVDVSTAAADVSAP